MVESIEEWRAELVEPGERQLHLGLDAGGTDNAAPSSVGEDVVEQSGLAHTSLAPDHHDAARPRSRTLDEPIECFGLSASILEA